MGHRPIWVVFVYHFLNPHSLLINIKIPHTPGDSDTLPKGTIPNPTKIKSNFICGKNSQVHKRYSLSGKTSLSFALKSFHNIKTGISLLSPNIIIITLNMLSSLYCEEKVKEVLTSVSPTFENLMIEICRNQIKNRNMKRYPPSLHL